MDLAALASFNHVAAHGGFGPAARATGQAKATLSRHVRELEESLGVRLVERGARTLRLTEEGSALFARTQGPLAELKEAGEALADGSTQARGRLRVSVPVLFAHVAVGRIAADFAALHPQVQLEVVAEDRYVDLVAEGFDAVIRVDPRPEHGLIGRCFLRDRHLVVAPPDLATPDPRAGSAGPIPAVILSGPAAQPRWTLLRDGRRVELDPVPVLRLSSLPMVRDAVRAGAGAAVLPASLVTEDLASKRLVCWGAASERHVELWVMHASPRLASPKVKAFVAFLCKRFDQVPAAGRE